ncbi:MAG: hypothetical protein ACR2J8_03140, partial [Thermomicrobiales bacterium]
DALVAMMARRISRRAGLGAAGALAALFAAGPSEAAKRGKGKGGDTTRGAKSGRKDRTPGAEGPCGDGSRQDNRCTRDNQCCTGICERATGETNNDGDGRCRCRKRRQACKENRNCCGKLACYGGSCATCKAGCKTGCCAGEMCVTEVTKTQCGANGQTCVACADGEECVSGACESICRVTVDPTILAGEVSPTPAGGSTIGIAAYEDRIYFTQIHKRNRVGSMNLDGSDLKWGPKNTYRQRLSGIAVNPVDGTIVALEYRYNDSIESIDPVTLRWAGPVGFGAHLGWAAEFDGDGNFWNSVDNQDAVYKNAGAAITPVCGGGATRGPRDLARGPEGLMFATCFEAGKVVPIDTATSTVLPDVYEVRNAYGVAFNGSTMYVVANENPVLIHEVIVTVESGTPVYNPRCVHTIAGRKQAGMATVDKHGKLWVSRGASRIKHHPKRP